MSEMPPQQAALLMGALSSVSFPVGATIGMCLNKKLPPKLLAGLLAYGAGALLFALVSELFIEHIRNPDSNFVHTAVLTISALLGALAFMKLATLLDDLEKKAAAKKRQRRRAQTATMHDRAAPASAQELSEPLSNTPLELEIDDDDAESQHRHRIHLEEDVEEPVNPLPLPVAVSVPHSLTEGGGKIPDRVIHPPEMVEWDEPEEEEQAHVPNVAISMWLGVMLDSIPESMYFGFLALQGKFSYALIIGVFFANLPEAVSSASMQLKRKDHPCKIISMWGGITISTSVIAFVATFMFPGVGQSETQEMVMLTCSGLAGGAMLGMVSSTMLPEAFEVGGRNVVSLSTVLGFLVAMLFSLIKDE
jgi:zinc transporter ZupT